MPMKIILVAINAKFIHSSLSVRCLRSENVHVREFTINQPEDLIISELFSQSPDMLAFSCYIWNIEMVNSIVRTFRKILPSVKIILGGPEITEEHENADISVIGEGELAFKEIIEGNQALKKVYKTTEVVALEDIPFAYTKFEENKILYYESSRGCVNNCAYCLSSTTKGVRFMPMERAKADLFVFLSNKVKQVKFVDRTFNSNKKHATEIWRYLIENDNGTSNFHFEIAGDLLDDDMLSLIAQARKGLFQFEIGVQSTNEKTLNAIGRKTNTAKLFENVAKLKTAGNVHLHLDLIAGLPFEDYSTFVRSFNDVMRCYPDKFQLGFLKLLKGSALRADANKYGIKFKDSAPYEILENDFISFAELNTLKKVENMLDLFYNSSGFKTYIKYMMRENPYDFFHSLALYWEQKGYHLLAHKKMALYTILYEFSDRSLKARELLKFDMLCWENIRSFPYWIEEYYRYDNKNLTKFSGIHTFKYDIFSDALQEKEIRVSFNYKGGSTNVSSLGRN